MRKEEKEGGQEETIRIKNELIQHKNLGEMSPWLQWPLLQFSFSFFEDS